MLSLKIVSPTEILFEGDTDFVAVPGSIGQLGILAGHAPLVSTLAKGKIQVGPRSSAKTFDVPGGFAEVFKNKVTVLVS